MEPRRQNLLLLLDNVPVQNMSSMKTRFAQVGAEDLECPAQSPDINARPNFVSKKNHKGEARRRVLPYHFKRLCPNDHAQ